MTLLSANDIKFLYPDLFKIDSPVLRDRYNAALLELTGRGSTLPSFNIDLCGFSPEIAEEFKDPFYLNPQGTNQLFIFLSTKQIPLPLIQQTFSYNEPILREFLAKNQIGLFNVSAREAVFGELQDSIYKLDRLDQVVNISRVHIEADTANKLISKSERLMRLVKRFERDDYSWQDDALLTEMLKLIKQVGDVRKNPLDLSDDFFPVGNFYTSYLGGLYVFHDVRKPFVVTPKDMPKSMIEDFNPNRVKLVSIDQPSKIVQLLDSQNLIVKRDEIDHQKIIDAYKERRNSVIVSFSLEHSVHRELPDLERSTLRRFIYKHVNQLPETFHQLSHFISHLESGRNLRELQASLDLIPYVLIPREGENSQLVSSLLAQLSPHDIFRKFLHGSTAFVELINGWDEEKRTFFQKFRQLTHMN